MITSYAEGKLTCLQITWKIAEGMKHDSWNQEWTKGGVRVNVCVCECKIAWSVGAIQKDCIQACGQFIQ